MQLGQPVTLRARAFPHRAFEGTVMAIAPMARRPDPQALERSLIVTTVLENVDGSLRPEMTGSAKISCGDRSLLDLMTRRLTRYLRVELFSWW